MNNTFNIQRFGLLLKRQWLEFGKIYLITLAVALGIIITFYGFSTWSYIDEIKTLPYRSLGFREPLFLIFGFLFITIISSSYFAHLGQKPKAIIDLMIPASTFEKFLASIFFTAVLSTISFLVIFYLTDFAFVSKLRSIYHIIEVTTYKDEFGNVVKASDNVEYFFTQNNPREFKSIFILIPFFVTSLFLLGSIYFNRFHYIKTAISLMIFAGIWTLIMVKTGQILFDGKIQIDHGNGNMNDGKFWAELGVFSLILLLTAIVWSITYIRLKEKEV